MSSPLEKQHHPDQKPEHLNSVNDSVEKLHLATAQVEQTYENEVDQVAKKYPDQLAQGDIDEIAHSAIKNEEANLKEVDSNESDFKASTQEALAHLEKKVEGKLDPTSLTNNEDRIDPSIGAQSLASHDTELSHMQAAMLGINAPEKKNTAATSQSFKNHDGLLG